MKNFCIFSVMIFSLHIHLAYVLTDHLNILAYIKAWLLPKNKMHDDPFLCSNAFSQHVKHPNWLSGLYGHASAFWVSQKDVNVSRDDVVRKFAVYVWQV